MKARRFLRMDGDDPQMLCRYCDDWWPVTPEFWLIGRDGHVRADRCRVCERERSRLYQTLRRMDPAFVASERNRQKRYREWLKKNHPDLVGAYDAHKRAQFRDYLARLRAA